MQIIKNILSWLYNQCKKLSFKDWIIILLSVVVLGFYISSRYYYKKTLYPTVVYSTDSLTVYKNKLNEEYKQKTIYILTIEQLKEENAEMYNEIKSLKDNPIVVTKTILTATIDTIYMESDSIYEKNDSTHKLVWHSYDSNGYYSITGNTIVNNKFNSFSTQINSLNIPSTLTLDIIEKDNKLSVIGKTDNPYVNITNADAVIIDPTQSTVIKSCFKQKRWSIGPQLGVGITSDLTVKPYIGIGISYGIIQF